MGWGEALKILGMEFLWQVNSPWGGKKQWGGHGFILGGAKQREEKGKEPLRSCFPVFCVRTLNLLC